MKYDDNNINHKDENLEDYDNAAYGMKANKFYDGDEGRDVLRAAWNLFGLTGAIEEYMLVKEIEKIRNHDKFS